MMIIITMIKKIFCGFNEQSQVLCFPQVHQIVHLILSEADYFYCELYLEVNKTSDVSVYEPCLQV